MQARARLLLSVTIAIGCQAQSLAPTGTLRAVFLESNPVQGRIDPKTGAITGPAADLTRELARQIGVPFSIKGVAGARNVIDSVKNHQADIGFLAFDPTRAVDVDFTNAYALSWSSFLVPLTSPLRGVNEADRSGIRIGAAAGDSPQLYLSRTMKNAEVKRYPAPSEAEIIRMLSAGEIDAWAANRQRLIEIAAHNTNFRVLPNNFFAVKQAIVVPKGDTAAVDRINRFLDDAKKSGLIQMSIDHAGLNGAVDVGQ